MHTATNVLGLAIGLGCVITVFVIIDFEYSFDQWHSSGDHTFRVARSIRTDYGFNHSGIIPYPYGAALAQHFPQIDKVVEFHGPKDEVISFTDANDNFQIYRQPDVLFTNAHFFDVLDFKLLVGEKGDLDEPGKVFLSESTAKKYFGEEHPVGKRLLYKNDFTLEVAGIVQDCPRNTNLPYTLLISMETMRKLQPSVWNMWSMTWAYSVYVSLHNDVNPENVESDLAKTLNPLAYPDDPDKWEKCTYKLQPIGSIHTDEKFGDGYHYVTPSLFIYSFLFLAVLILCTACLNFVNLNTAIAIRRSLEVGVRKTLGSSRAQLVTQFLLETFLVVLLALTLGFFLTQSLIEGFNRGITVVSFTLELTNRAMVFGVICSFFVTVLAGIYPAMVLAGFRPVQAIKNAIALQVGSGSFNVRRVLVVAQFTFTAVLIVLALLVSAQMSHVKNRDLGFDSSQVMLINTPSQSAKDPYLLQQAFLKKSYVAEACMAYSPPMSDNNWNNYYHLPGTEVMDEHRANIKFIDEDYIDFYRISLLAGSIFSNDNGQPNDSTYRIVVNEKLAASLDWQPNEAIGKTIMRNNDFMQIVGVVKDYNIYGAQSDIQPVIMHYEKTQQRQLAIRISRFLSAEDLADVKSTFTHIYPDGLFEMAELQDKMDELYAIENFLMIVIRLVALLAILLSITGLYGLVSYIALRQAKVIGIRKVFGASTFSILSSLTKEYLVLLAVAFMVATPASYFLAELWISEFAYRIALTPFYFLAGFAIIVVIAISTVGYRSFLAAKANPVVSLRYE